MQKIKRKRTRVIEIGKVKIGGGYPIIIQGMTKKDTEDAPATIAEIKQLEKAGCELVRVAVKSVKAAKNISKIKGKINIPLIADIHFDYKLALVALEYGVDKIRINPGNISKTGQLRKIIDRAKYYRVPIRIGLNSGSVPFSYKEDTLARKISDWALKYLKLFEDNDFYNIIISVKTSNIFSTIRANELIAKKTNYPLHLGVTATGPSYEGLVKSAIGIGCLLKKGIGDTIRVSLTSSSLKEIEVAKSILEALEIRRFSPEVISCPTCGRCQVDLISIAEDIKKTLNEKAKRDKRLLNLTFAVMGCEVNGPGEARAADIGVACGRNSATLFKKGKIVRKIKIKDVEKELLKEADNEMD